MWLVSVELFNGALGAAFAPTRYLLLSGERLALDFDITVAGAPATVEWFMEFTSQNPSDPATSWHREVAEEDIGGGVTHMPVVVRDFAALAAGTTRLSAQFIRAHDFVRLQMRAAVGAVPNLAVTAPFGSQPAAPSP